MVKQLSDQLKEHMQNIYSKSVEMTDNPLILIVDDEEAIRIPIRFSLENFGFEVIEAENGEEAIALFLDRRPDLILLDVLMRGVDGLKTCVALRNSPGGVHVPIIMITSLEDEDTVINAFYSGATDFVAKPLNLTILGYRIRYWLRASATLANLQRSEERLTKAQKIAKLGHWEWALDTDIIEVRSSTPGIFGLESSLSYNDFLNRIDVKDREHVARQINRAIKAKKGFYIQYSIRDTRGVERIILNQAEFVEKERGDNWSMIGVVQDITEMQHAERKIRYLANYDGLTGLPNRSMFREHWNKVRALQKRSSVIQGIIYIDLDHFKHLNDSLGHSVGDQVLIEVAERLKSVLPEAEPHSKARKVFVPSLLSRIGSDDFILLVTNLHTLEKIASLAQRIVDIIAHPFEVFRQELNLSASVGISIYPEDGEDIDTLLKHAETAMHAAKNSGRNKYQFFYQAMNDVIATQFMLQNKFRRALEQKEFTLYYQPKFSNKRGDIKGVEALIRWQDPEEGIVSPNEFLPFAEENNLIHEINDWVIHEACAQAKKWVSADLFHGCRMSLNISGRGIDFPALQETICGCLKKMDLDPRFLEIELTERVMMENTEEAKKILMYLKEIGVSIAIDDFGTGYSALSHLQLFPLTTLKIDKSFIQNAETTKNGLTLLLSIINIAKSLELKVVAEGVETVEQKHVLGTMDCDELQGYLMSYPQPAGDIEEKLSYTPTEECASLFKKK